MKKYWKSIDELKNTSEQEKTENLEEEQKNLILGLFDDGLKEKSASRRDFLKLCGFSITTAALVASCERPIQKAIPYLFKLQTYLDRIYRINMI